MQFTKLYGLAIDMHPKSPQSLYTKYILLSLSALFIELQLYHVAVIGRSTSPPPEHQHEQFTYGNHPALFIGPGLSQHLGKLSPRYIQGSM